MHVVISYSVITLCIANSQVVIFLILEF